MNNGKHGQGTHCTKMLSPHLNYLLSKTLKPKICLLDLKKKNINVATIGNPLAVIGM